ncbi:MAG: hypothetical protein EKK64_06925 [Neisseriaceae bacterium]|nr:MAG: hypothetical protein EKK64_06925 [Neisseriaceae bacterium]
MDYELAIEKIQNVAYYKRDSFLLLSALEDHLIHPMIIWYNGTKEWMSRGLLHRHYGLPAIIYSNGDQEWWFDGKRHRLEGPAAIYGNKHYWFKDGEFIKMEINNGN